MAVKVLKVNVTLDCLWFTRQQRHESSVDFVQADIVELVLGM